MNDLLSQLKDIEGLDKITWWPLAIGWWIVICIISAALVAGLAYYIHKRIYANSWKGALAKSLSNIKDSIGNKNSQAVVTEISEILRKIALQRFSREQCAGLVGDNWLKFLTENDPAGFNWLNNGRLLTEAAYAPPSREVSGENVMVLINAARKWVK